MRRVSQKRATKGFGGGLARVEAVERRVLLSASVAGVIYLDLNGDGVRDPGEPGLAGRKVFVDSNATREWEAGEAYVVSGADGSYRFDGLAAGTARVLDVVPDGWKATMTNRTTDPFFAPTLTDGQTAVLDLGTVPEGRTLRLDSAFGTGGIVSVATPWGQHGFPSRAFPVSDGSVFMWVEASNGTQYLRRMAADGTVDATFGGSLGVVFSDAPRAVVLQPDGKVVVASGDRVYRFNPNGTKDDTLGFFKDGFVGVNTGSGDQPDITDLLVDGAGRILVAATSRPSTGASTRQFRVVRLKPLGTIDTQFPLVQIGSADKPAIATTADGKVVATFGMGANQSDSIARWNADGTEDTTFGAAGYVRGTFDKPYTFWNDVAVLADGRVLVGGRIDAVSGPGSALAVMRYTAAGKPDATFGTGQVPGMAQTSAGSAPLSFGSVYQLLLEADGGITVGGTVGPYSAVPDVGVARYTADGRSDRSFAGGGFGHLNLTGDIDTFRGMFRVGGKLRVFARTNFNPGYARWVQLDETPSPVASLGAGGTLTVNGTAGDDTIELHEDPTYVRVTVNGATGAYYAPSLTQINVRAGAGDDSVTVDLRTRIPTSVLGEDGADALVVMGTPGADRILLTPGVTSVGAVLVTHAAESVTVEGLAGDDSFDLQGFYEGVSVTLDGGDGNDTFAPFDASSARSLDDWRGTATFVGGAGVDSLLLDDRANISGYGFEVDGSSVRRTLTAPIGYSGLERLTIQAGPGNNPFAVTPSAQTAIEVRGGDPAAGAAEWDSLVLTPRGATAGIFTPGSEAGSGTYTFSNRQPVTFTGVERASADLTPPAVLAAAFVPGGGGKAVVRVTFGEDVGASLAAGDLALTNVATGDMRSATGVTFDPGSGVATFTVPDLADGNWRATLAAAGVEDAAGNPLAADFSTDFFVLAGDANRDRVVNFADLLVLAKNYNKAGATWAEGDFTGDGVVNFADLLVLAKAYNTAVAAPAPLLSGEPAVAPVSATASVLGEEGKTAPVFSTTRVAKPAAAVAPARPVVVKAKAAGRAKGR